MASVLFIAAHPALELSRTNGPLTEMAQDMEGVTVRRLYDIYPDFHFDLHVEHELLEQHDHLVLQYPVYWYMPPALLKEWLDQVFSDGWAFGEGATALKGKTLTLSLSVGSEEAAYREGGVQGQTLETFLIGMKQVASICGMRYCDPLVMYGSQGAGDSPVEAQKLALAAHLKGLMAEGKAA